VHQLVNARPEKLLRPIELSLNGLRLIPEYAGMSLKTLIANSRYPDAAHYAAIVSADYKSLSMLNQYVTNSMNVRETTAVVTLKVSRQNSLISIVIVFPYPSQSRIPTRYTSNGIVVPFLSSIR
jgi:hypothetical protein